MKNIFDYYLKYTVISVFLLSSIISYAQNKSIFSARSQENQIRQIYTTFTASDTVSLEGLGPIYALSVDASIYQPREASFTRIVLEDIHGHDYLVAESDWSRNDTTTVHLDHYCEETAMLDSVQPLRLKCFLAGDATLMLKVIHYSDQLAIRKTGNQKETRESVKLTQVQNIVDRINSYNQKHRKLWKAGINDLVISSYENRNKIFRSDETNSSISDFIYYKSGLYELGILDSIYPEPMSLCVDSFDWSTYQGKNWLTSVRDQGITPFCQTFAAVGMTESAVRTYFNNDAINLDLSEHDVISYTFNNPDEYVWSGLGSPIDYIINNGVIDEATLPFNNMNMFPSLIDPRPLGQELVSFTSYYLVYWIENATPQLDKLKRAIITYGPGAAAIKLPSDGHAMVLYGYGKVTPGIYWTISSNTSNNNDVISEINDPRIGRTFWKFKNSWGTSWGNNGFADVIIYDYKLMHQCYFVYGNITREGHSDNEINCEDIDGDGYYYWGKSSSPPTNLPCWAPSQKDGNDLDQSQGPLDYYGYPQNINPDSLSIIYIDNDSTFNSKKYIANHIHIRNNSTLTIRNLITTNSNSIITIDQGSVLKLDGGTICNANISPAIGSSLIIDSGGRIISSRGKTFLLPTGVKLNINNGEIINRN